MSVVAESVEQAWVTFIVTLRLEDGLRFVLDHELELHDLWINGEVSVDEISRLALEHWRKLTTP